MFIKKINSLTFKDETGKQTQTNFTQDTEFKKYNIIYGLNGSGKSSISRLINSFSNQKRQRDGGIIGSFTVDNDIILSTESINSNDNLMVFNRDFIDENLIFHRDEKNIKYDYINISLSTNNINDELILLETKIKSLDSIQNKVSEKIRNLKEGLKNKIVQSLNLATSHSYNITSLNNDIEKYQHLESNKLSTEELDNKISFLKNYKNEHKEIQALEYSNLIERINSIMQKINVLLSKPQLIDGTISRLSSDSNLNNCILSMYNLMINNQNKYSNDSCPFCETENIIIKDKPDITFQEFFETLKSHFNKNYQNIKNEFDEIKNDIKEINTETNKNHEILAKKYTFLDEESDKIFDRFKIDIQSFYDRANNIISELMTLSENKFNAIQTSNYDYNYELNTIKVSYNNIVNIYKSNINQMNIIIANHNDIIQNKEQKKQQYTQEIKNHYLSDNFNKLSLYNNRWLFRIENIKQNYDKNKNDLESSKNEKINEFKNKHLSNINKLLSDRLNISFQLHDNGNIYIERNNSEFDINNLSEGEKNIILFTYFVSLVKQNQNPITLIIDDPHSSLDEKYKNNIIQLVKDKIVGESQISQLILLSHDVPFLVLFNKEFITNTKVEHCNHYKLQKYNNNINLKIEQEPRFSYSTKYLNDYKKIISFYDNNISTVPYIGIFIEEMGRYLYPRYKEKSIAEKGRLLIGENDGLLINILRHEQGNDTEEQRRQLTYEVIHLLLNTTNNYIKNHIDELDKAIDKK